MWLWSKISKWNLADVVFYHSITGNWPQMFRYYLADTASTKRQNELYIQWGLENVFSEFHKCTSPAASWVMSCCQGKLGELAKKLSTNLQCSSFCHLVQLHIPWHNPHASTCMFAMYLDTMRLVNVSHSTLNKSRYRTWLYKPLAREAFAPATSILYPDTFHALLLLYPNLLIQTMPYLDARKFFIIKETTVEIRDEFSSVLPKLNRQLFIKRQAIHNFISHIYNHSSTHVPVCHATAPALCFTCKSK